jgi:RNA polymerase sigma factor (sigma-70 family)
VIAGLTTSEIFKKYNIRLKSFINKRVSSVDDAEDILQEVYYQLSLADMLMKPVDQLNAWLFTVARNRIIDWYRKRKDQSTSRIKNDPDDDEVEELMDFLSSNDDNPETQYLNNLIWEEIKKAMDDLPLEQREAFELNEIYGLSFKEISDKKGVPVNTLISRKRYAIAFLREQLKLFYNEFINF